MGWETALDRLLMQQIHLAEKDQSKADAVRRQLVDYGELADGRPGQSFLFGYASALLGFDLPTSST
ncbi:MAG: hypothetical protein KAI24_10370, partial [Planctomycetes bacterium]|nr:hypothetical protein [Planctomycetota bacterium]